MSYKDTTEVIVVATTTIQTMLEDTEVAFWPTDRGYKHLYEDRSSYICHEHKNDHGL